MAFASVWLIHVLLAAPTPGEATANGYPAWQGLSDANHVAGRIISPSDLRQRVAIVVEIDSAKAYDHLLIAAELAVHFNQVTLPNSGSWDFFEQHPNSIVLVVNRGARLTSAKFGEVAQSKNKDDNLKFMQMKNNLVPVYNDVSFAGAPDAAGKYPFYYVMGPSGVEPIDQGPAVRGFNRTLKPKIQKAIEDMSAGGQVWRPYYGFSSDSDLTAELKGLLAKGKPLKAFEQKLQKKINSPNVEISKGSQLLYDGLMQTKGELLLRIRMESLQCPHRAVYDRQTLLKYWPTAKKDIYPKIDNFSSEAMVMAKMLEKIMLWRSPDFKSRGRPFIACGDRSFTRTFSPRMTHSGWEVERFPDIYMDQVAHAGMDAILVFVEDPPNMTRNGREDLQALSKRACTHGLDVYAYCSFPVKAAKYNPNDAGAEDWYDKTYGSIVREAPGIRGMIFVGESVAFPVRDGSSAGYWWGRKDERRPDKPLNGFYPTDEWASWLQKVSKVTRRYRSDLDLVFWTYNWYSRPAEIRLPLLEKIPTNITLLVTFAMGDTPEKKLGIDTWMWDYSITRPGPGKVFESEADVAKRRGIRLYSMANTGGRTWDIGCAPYQPVPGRWITRFKNLREARSRWGLSGLMECHHYGFQPNLISELAKISFTDETDMKSLIDILRKIAARDFGHDNVDAVLSAWQDWAEAFSWHSAHHCDLAGPLRTGPTYPFVLPGERRPEPLEPVYDYYEGKRVGDGWRYLEPEYSMPYDLLPTYVEMSRREIDFWEKGCSKLRMVMKRVPISTIGAARRILANGEFHLSTARTLLNVRLFRLQGAKYLDESLSLADRQTARDSLLEIIKDERTNVERTIGVVEVDSALGWEPTMHYVCGPRQLKWKLQHLSSVERMLHAPDRSALREGFK